jgi:hypothetical protein
MPAVIILFPLEINFDLPRNYAEHDCISHYLNYGQFENRIYSNLKLDGNPVPMTLENVLPGEFRSTGYTFQSINDIFAEDFLSYCGWNKLDFKQQEYTATNEFTWNYSNTTSRLDQQPLLGAWRGIYRYYYDTQQPSYSPWEMLGFATEPTWWASTYGPAPYTADNLVLWDDLEAGYVADPVAPAPIAPVVIEEVIENAVQMVEEKPLIVETKMEEDTSLLVKSGAEPTSVLHQCDARKGVCIDVNKYKPIQCDKKAKFRVGSEDDGYLYMCAGCHKNYIHGIPTGYNNLKMGNTCHNSHNPTDRDSSYSNKGNRIRLSRPSTWILRKDCNYYIYSLDKMLQR